MSDQLSEKEKREIWKRACELIYVERAIKHGLEREPKSTEDWIWLKKHGLRARREKLKEMLRG